MSGLDDDEQQIADLIAGAFVLADGDSPSAIAKLTRAALTLAVVYQIRIGTSPELAVLPAAARLQGILGMIREDEVPHWGAEAEAIVAAAVEKVREIDRGLS